MTKKDQEETVNVSVDDDTITTNNIVKDQTATNNSSTSDTDKTADPEQSDSSSTAEVAQKDGVQLIFDAVDHLGEQDSEQPIADTPETATDNTDRTVDITTSDDETDDLANNFGFGNTPDLIVELVDTVTNMTRLQTIPADKSKFSENLQHLLQPILDKGYLTKDKLPVQPASDRIRINLTHQTRNVTRNKTVEQIIEYTMIDKTKAPDKVKRQLHFVQNGIKDLVTKQIDWDDTPQTQSFSAISSPECTGYEPDIPVVPKQEVTVTNENFMRSLDRNILVNYIREVLHIAIALIDDDKNGKCLQTINLTGYNKQYLPLTADKLAASFKKNHLLISQSNLPEKIVFKTGQSPTYQIHLVHELEDVVTNDPELKAESHYTIYFKDKFGQELQKPYIIKQEFQRNGQRDLVTGQIKYSNWKPVGNIAKYATLPKMLKDQDGKELIPLNTQIEIPELKANVNSQIEQIYLVPKQYVTLIFTETGKEVHRMTLKFDVFEDRFLKLEQIADDLKKHGIRMLRGQNTPQQFSYNQEKDDNRQYQIEVEDILDEKTEHVPEKRIIEVTMPNGAVRRIVQNSPLERIITINLRTNEKSYGKWSPNVWDEYRPPLIKGYAPTRLKVEYAIVDDDISKPRLIKINYLPYNGTADKETATNQIEDQPEPEKKTLFSRIKSLFSSNDQTTDTTLKLDAPDKQQNKK